VDLGFHGSCPALNTRPSLERFQAKWKPVRVKKTRQIKNPEPRFDSIEAEKALASEIISIPLDEPLPLPIVFERFERSIRQYAIDAFDRLDDVRQTGDERARDR
jgi:hypothetical protein